MTEDEMVQALRAKGYAVRQRATGFYVIRYKGPKHWSSQKEEMKYHLRRTSIPGQGTQRGIPADAEIAEIDFSTLKWRPFWPKGRPHD